MVMTAGLPGCASQSFRSFKQRLVSKSDEVIVTFYDSEFVNAKKLQQLTEFHVDNQVEVGQFRRFIRHMKSSEDDCGSDGTVSFQNEQDTVQQMSFNLENRCISFLSENAPNGTSKHRLSRKGTQWLESLRETQGGQGY